MFPNDTTGADTLDATTIALLTAAAITALAALWGIDALARRTTAHARARARVRAQQWARHRAATARRRARQRARTRASARSFMDTRGARRAILAVLTLTATAATVLSAHGVQDALTGAGLTAWWARAAGLIAFEGFLLVMASLSWWHRTTGQTGADVYGALVWGGAAVLAIVGYHGGGDWIYAVFAPMAALGFHLLTGAERRRRGNGATWLGRAGAAIGARWDALTVRLGRTPTGEDTTARDAERRRSRVIARAVKTHRARRARAWRTWLFERALADAEARGLLDEHGRALIAERCAARYTALDALAPATVTDGAPLWARPTTAREIGPEDDAPRAPRVPKSAPAVAPVRALRTATDNEPAPADIGARITGAFPASAPDGAAAWCAEHYRSHGRLPTGREIGDAFGSHPGNARKWLKPVKDAIGA